jgi:hypothetical protein
VKASANLCGFEEYVSPKEHFDPGVLILLRQRRFAAGNGPLFKWGL